MANTVNRKCWSIVQYVFGTQFIHPGVQKIRSHTLNCIVNLVSFSQITIVFDVTNVFFIIVQRSVFRRGLGGKHGETTDFNQKTLLRSV